MNARPVTAAAFADAGLDDWRYLLGAIEATFRASSGSGDDFTAAARFVGRVAEAADAADHHPDLHLRYPGVVHVALSTHSIHGLSELDLGLARTISDLAVAAGLRAVPDDAERIEIAVDATDIDAVRPFWAAVLGHRTVDGRDDLDDPRRRSPSVWFQQMDTPRTERNRIHLDVTVPHDRAEERVAAAIAAGGTLLSDRDARAFWVLADPEGNEVCVCTWQDRD